MIALVALLAATTAHPSSPIPAATSQLVLVTTPDWSAPRGTLTRWERTADGWRKVGTPMAVVVGRAGLGWGRGMHDPALPRATRGPEKREGDGRGPAGVFRFGSAFGYDENPPPGTRWPYRASAPGAVCVDDPRSRLYNQIVPVPPRPLPWRHAEPMRLRDDDYRLVLVVEHNAAPPARGAGSCIFLHIASPPDVPTAGCTALRPDDMTTLVAWLEPSASPVLVQLPDSVRSAWAKRWPGPPFVD